MTFVGKGFNKVSYYVKKLEGVTQIGHANILAKKSPNVVNFSGSISKGHG